MTRSVHAEEPKPKREAPPTPPLPNEVTEVRDALIAALGDDLRALLWQGSWARGEQTPESDHDMVVILRRANDDILDRLRAVFAGRPGWSTYVKTEQEIRQYPAGGRIQFHYGIVPLYGAIEPPPLIPEGIIDDLRRFAVDLNHETRYRLLHGRKHYDNHGDAAFGRVRNARILYYFTKIAILAMKARRLLTEGSYPSTRAGLRARTTDPLELQIIDVVDRWADLKPQYEADFTPLARLLDAYARRLVAWLDATHPTSNVQPPTSE